MVFARCIASSLAVCRRLTTGVRPAKLRDSPCPPCPSRENFLPGDLRILAASGVFIRPLARFKGYLAIGRTKGRTTACTRRRHNRRGIGFILIHQLFLRFRYVKCRHGEAWGSVYQSLRTCMAELSARKSDIRLLLCRIRETASAVLSADTGMSDHSHHKVPSCRRYRAGIGCTEQPVGEVRTGACRLALASARYLSASCFLSLGTSVSRPSLNLRVGLMGGQALASLALAVCSDKTTAPDTRFARRLATGEAALAAPPDEVLA